MAADPPPTAESGDGSARKGLGSEWGDDAHRTSRRSTAWCTPALIDLVDRAAGMVARRSNGRVTVDGLALLGERAALGYLGRQGAISCGGGRLVRAADGWLAVSLARRDDFAVLPAWLQRDVPTHDPWTAVSDAAATISVFSP